jgi:hypothetical protein
MDKVPSHSERTDAAHLRLVAALDPKTVQERVLVDWLRQALDLSHLERLAVMVERARRDVWPR